MRFYSYLLATLLILLLVSCASQTASDVTGNWSGELSSGSSIALQLNQSGSMVDGTAVIAGSSEFPATLSGTLTNGRISLTGQDDFGPVSIEASVSPTTMQGDYSAVDPATNAPTSLTFTASR